MEEWEIVKAKERKKKAARKDDQDSKEEAQSSTDEQQDYGPAKKIAPTGPGQKWATTIAYVDDNGKAKEKEVIYADDEWDVS